ncbi:hypothetical protein, partial [Caballeronia grimmiae]|uniref:hypothetical protein n=1 Tax=Caballeronia grimmiae TaxID=1071679 RepID=UPI0019D3BBDD
CEGREFDPPPLHHEFALETTHYVLRCSALFCVLKQVFAHRVWRICGDEELPELSSYMCKKNPRELPGPAWT